MKKSQLSFAAMALLAGLISCNSPGTSTTTTTTNTSNIDTNSGAPSPSSNYPNTVGTNRLPLNPEDSAFVMKAAIGGMKEVESGNVAQQNAANARVKAFGMMMVNDHSKSNSELMALVSGRGMTIPASLPPDVMKEVENMRKMKGQAFDKHYMSMMVADHQKTIAEFEKQANSGSDPEIKSFAAKTLPILQMHRDSAQAINKSKL